jgi:hypothetical protein
MPSETEVSYAPPDLDRSATLWYAELGRPTIMGVFMARKIVYWISTAVVCLALFGSLTYLTGSAEVVAGFAKAGYPQHLRIVLGIAKPVAAIVLLLPGLALLKEWAYAGVTFALVMATISSYLSGEGVKALLPVALLMLVAVSYFTRPPNRRLVANLFGVATP